MLRPNAMQDPSRPRLPSAAPAHPREFERLASVCGLALCDRGSDPALDGIARRAAELCEAPFALVTLVREHDQIFLGRHSISGHSTERDEAVCAHTILVDETFVVEDLRADPRFAELPVAKNPPYVRFYAGAPVFDGTGLPLGSLCVLDAEPRRLDSRALLALSRLAGMAGVVLESRRLAVDLLEARPHPGATDAAFARLDRILAPLLDGAVAPRATLR